MTHLFSNPLFLDPDADAALTKLKRLFTSAPAIVQPNTSCQFIVEVDVSDTGVGVVLSQPTALPQTLHSCAFFSQRSPLVVGDK